MFAGAGADTERSAPEPSPQNRPDLSAGQMVVQVEDVAAALGTEWTNMPPNIDALTPCSDSELDYRESAVVRAEGGWSGTDSMTQLVTKHESRKEALASYEEAVTWFTDCGGMGADQSETQDSLAQRSAEQPKPPGIDESRVVVRMREQIGSQLWTNTVAAVLRSGDVVAVLAWDVTIDDNPGVYDDRFLGLVRVLASQLTMAATPATADQALLQADHAAVQAVLGEDINDQLEARTSIDVTEGVCFQGPSTGRPSGVVSAGSSFLVNEKEAKNVHHSVMTFASETEAAEALDASLPRDPVCEDAGETRKVEVLDVTGGAESCGYEVVDGCCGPAERRFVYAARVGSSVLRMVVESKDGRELDRGELLDLYDAAVARLRSAS